MLSRRVIQKALGVGLSGAALLATSGTASALDYKLGELKIHSESSITAGVALRTQEASTQLIGKANVANAVQVDSSAKGAYSTNGDDGNQAFDDAGDLFFSQLKLSTDLTLKVGDWGIFARGNYRYDPNIESRNLLDGFDYGPTRTRTLAEKRRRENLIDDNAGSDFELFDLYLFGNFKIGNRSASIRIGRQVFNWGEATFIANGINSIIPIDARQARGPGAEVKEIFRPFGAIWGSIQLIKNVSLEAFYQFDFENTIPDPSGTFFSTADFIGGGAADVQLGFGRCNENLLAPGAFAGAPPAVAAANSCPLYGAAGTNVPELASDDPHDGGQYGFRLTSFLPALNATEISLYYVNYHSRLPLLNGVAANPGAITNPALDPDGDPRNVPGAGFRRAYPEDIELYGLSFNTFFEPLEIAVQGEYSFHHDQPLQIDDVDLLLFALTPLSPVLANGQTIGAQTGQDTAGPGLASPGQEIQGFQRFDYHQWNVSFTKFIGPSWTGANQIVLLGEFAGQYIEDLPNPDVLPFEAAATYVPNSAFAAAALQLPSQDRAGYADDFAWGYRLVAAFRYLSVLDRFNLTPSVRFFHDVQGNSPTPISTFLEDRKQVSLGVSAEYLDAWEAGFSYTIFFDSNNSAAPPIDASQYGQRLGGQTSNVVEDRDFVNLFVRYTF